MKIIISCSPKFNIYIELFTIHTCTSITTRGCNNDTFVQTSEHMHVHTHIQTRWHILHTQDTIHAQKSPFYFCILSVPHIVIWASESLSRHKHTCTRACHPPHSPYSIALLLSGHVATTAAAGSICTTMRHKSGPPPAERLLFSHCLPLLSHFI